MKNLNKAVVVLAVAAGLSGACNDSKTPGTGSTGANPSAFRETQLPGDAYESCTLTQPAFDSFFVSGKASANGAVLPANSVAFPHNNNCDFYKWSEQMFLWITSNSSGAYGNAGTVMESPVFFDVTPEDATGHRQLVRHEPNLPIRMSNRLVKDGPNRLPMVRDLSGRLFEVEEAAPSASNLGTVKDSLGKLVEVHAVRPAENGALALFDRTGKKIGAPKAVIRHALHRDRILQAFTTSEGRVLIDQNGNQVQTEEGQATGDILMASNGSLVYYLTMVNDVYAYFLTAVSQGKMKGLTFPTTAGARDSICAYARLSGAVLPDSNALAIELKTSWVEAVNLTDAAGYVTIDAVIPTYDTSNPQKWVPTGERKAKMALIGMHVVGSVANHPEMVWATFEHKSNTPDSVYPYRNNQGGITLVPADSTMGWLLSNNPNSAGHNNSYLWTDNHNSGDTVFIRTGSTAQASNTLRILPWGSAMGTRPNQQDSTTADANAEVIAINSAIRKLLPGSDKRKNYLLRGATWTQNGVSPNGSSYSSTNTAYGAAIGTSSLANSTMETYFQGGGNSCFTCHSGSSNQPDQLSHIFGRLAPLTPLQARMEKAVQPKPAAR